MIWMPEASASHLGPRVSVQVHPGAAVVKQHRTARARPDHPVDGSAYRRRQRDHDHLDALAAHAQGPVAMLFARVSYLRAGGFEDPLVQHRPSMATSAKSYGFADSRAVVSKGLMLQVSKPQDR